jgi:hypothetical protein
MAQFLQPRNQDTPAKSRISSALTLAYKEEESVAPRDFVPLHLESRTHVSTAVMCRHLGRKPQTARGWACHESYPTGLRPERVMGRLAWPVAGIRSLLGVSAATVQAEAKGRPA